MYCTQSQEPLCDGKPNTVAAEDWAPTYVAIANTHCSHVRRLPIPHPAGALPMDEVSSSETRHQWRGSLQFGYPGGTRKVSSDLKGSIAVAVRFGLRPNEESSDNRIEILKRPYRVASVYSVKHGADSKHGGSTCRMHWSTEWRHEIARQTAARARDRSRTGRLFAYRMRSCKG